MKDFFDKTCNAITHLKFAVGGHLTFYAIANAQMYILTQIKLLC